MSPMIAGKRPRRGGGRKRVLKPTDFSKFFGIPERAVGEHCVDPTGLPAQKIKSLRDRGFTWAKTHNLDGTVYRFLMAPPKGVTVLESAYRKRMRKKRID